MSDHETWEKLKALRLNGAQAHEDYLHDRRRMELGEEVRRLREARGMSQKELATRLRRSVRVIDRLEFGDLPITAALLRALQQAFGEELSGECILASRGDGSLVEVDGNAARSVTGANRPAH